MDWRSEIVALLHEHRIKQKELAEEIGVSEIWVSYVINGRENPKGMEKRMRDAIDAIVARRAEDDV